MTKHNFIVINKKERNDITCIRHRGSRLTLLLILLLGQQFPFFLQHSVSPIDNLKEPFDCIDLDATNQCAAQRSQYFLSFPKLSSRQFVGEYHLMIPATNDSLLCLVLLLRVTGQRAHWPSIEFHDERSSVLSRAHTADCQASLSWCEVLSSKSFAHLALVLSGLEYFILTFYWLEGLALLSSGPEGKGKK